MSTGVTLSSKHQVVIPKEARDALQLTPGRRLMVKVQGSVTVMVPQPDDPVKALRGLHKEVWAENEGGDYLRKERNSWDDN